MSIFHPTKTRHEATSVIALVVAVGCGMTTWNNYTSFEGPHGVAAFTNLIIASAGLVGTLAGLWVSLSYAILARARHAHRATFAIRVAGKLATPTVRRTLAAWTASTTLLVPPALATTDTRDTDADLGWGASSAALLLDDESEGLFHPDLGFGSRNWNANNGRTFSFPDAPLSRAPLPVAASPTHPHDQYLVKPGDTLWAIATAHLPIGANATDIATATDAWIEANADLIPDPHLIHPGQLLISPEEIP